MTDAYHNHYVPKWYQKRFLLPGQSRYHYLDLHPEKVTSPGGTTYTRNALLPWGPKRCFRQDDLYTAKLGAFSTDEIEKRFFGPIDHKGQKAVEFFTEYSFRKGVRDALHDLIDYMDVQRIRTPRGLDWLKTFADVDNHYLALMAMQQVFQMNITMWMEGVWEIVRARNSPTKFIVTDQPVAFYNAKAFPQSQICRYPSDVGLDQTGTRTIFPLGMDACLIITHVQLVRNPRANPIRPRINARAYKQTIMNLVAIQFGRELEEEEVNRINFILKMRATRYVAASEKEWLYPEKQIKTQHWSKLDEDWFLFPNPYKVQFTSGIIFGYEGGGSFAMDEYGRNPGHPNYEDKQTHDRDWDSYHRARKEWAVKRKGRSLAHVHESRGDEADDRIMRKELNQIEAE